MPRGHLKHTKGISRKKARGGASHSQRQPARDSSPSTSTPSSADVEDFAVAKPPRKVSAAATRKTTNGANRTSSSSSSTACCGSSSNKAAAVKECAICFEEGPVLCLSRHCRWHDAACHKFCVEFL